MSDHKDVQHVLHTVKLDITFNLMNNEVNATVNGRRDDLLVEIRGEDKPQDTIPNDRALKARYEEHEREYFDMSKKPKGKVLVINNDFSHDKDRNRTEGSEQDVKNLEQAFKQLGGRSHGSQVDINIIRNLSSKGIKAHLQLFIEESSKIPSFVAIVIMSHGTGTVDGDDIVCGNDGTRCKVSELVELFKSKDEWKEVPVMMFFQMCRGSDVGPSAYQEITSAQLGTDKTDSTPFFQQHREYTTSSKSIKNKLLIGLRRVLPSGRIIGPNDDMGEDQMGAETKGKDEIDLTAEDYASQVTNMLISFATGEGSVSVLNTLNGSWYIQELCKAIENFSSEKDMIAIMNHVHDKVNRRTSENPNLTNFAMACDSSHTFEKKFEFFPGFPEN